MVTSFTKKCSKCKEDKSIEEFSKRALPLEGPRAACKKCSSASSMDYYRTNLEKVKDGKLKRRYGIDQEIFNEMFNKQEGRCLICKRHQSELEKTLHVDHDHNTGKVRGLLCQSCNVGLGNYEDSIVYLTNAITYLKERGY